MIRDQDDVDLVGQVAPLKAAQQAPQVTVRAAHGRSYGLRLGPTAVAGAIDVADVERQQRRPPVGGKVQPGEDAIDPRVPG